MEAEARQSMFRVFRAGSGKPELRVFKGLGNPDPHLQGLCVKARARDRKLAKNSFEQLVILIPL